MKKLRNLVLRGTREGRSSSATLCERCGEVCTAGCRHDALLEHARDLGRGSGPRWI
jgi:hypothetical protein